MLFISGEITARTVEEVHQALSSGRLDKIILNSQGGDLYAGFAIYDAILGKDITVHCTGFVASSAIVVMLGGAHRDATPLTRFMTHKVAMETDNGIEPDPDDLRELETTTNLIVDLLTSRSRISKEVAQSLLAQNVHFGVREAESWGLIDGVKGIQ